MLELHAGKLARAVLRGRGGSNASLLPDQRRAFGMDFWDADLRAAVRAMIAEVEGKPCVHVGGDDGAVFVCRAIRGLETDEDSVTGVCDWVDPADARPDELT